AGLHKGTVDGFGSLGSADVLGMELSTHEEGMLFELENLRPPPAVAECRVAQPLLLQPWKVRLVKLVSMPVPLSYLLRTVYLVSPARPLDVHIMPSEPHRPAELRHFPLLWEKVNHGVGGLGVDLRAVRALQAEGASREGDGRELEAEAESQKWSLHL